MQTEGLRTELANRVLIVTLDRAVLMVVWSVYILVGRVLKDRRLLFFIGTTYRDYQARVPGYPGMPLGPLARVIRIGA